MKEQKKESFYLTIILGFCIVLAYGFFNTCRNKKPSQLEKTIEYNLDINDTNFPTDMNFFYRIYDINDPNSFYDVNDRDFFYPVYDLKHASFFYLK